MDNQAWRDLIGLVPQKQHNKLVIMTYVGVEILVQDLVRVQEDYLVIRGRLAGRRRPAGCSSSPTTRSPTWGS